MYNKSKSMYRPGCLLEKTKLLPIRLLLGNKIADKFFVERPEELKGATVPSQNEYICGYIMADVYRPENNKYISVNKNDILIFKGKHLILRKRKMGNQQEITMEGYGFQYLDKDLNLIITSASPIGLITYSGFEVFME